MAQVPDDRDWSDDTYETLFLIEETFENSGFAAEDISISDVGDVLDSLITNGMPPKQAQWTVLRHGYTRTELADVLGKSQGAVDYTAHAAREYIDKQRRLSHNLSSTGLRRLLASRVWPTDADIASHHAREFDEAEYRRTERFNSTAAMPRGRYYLYEELGDVDGSSESDRSQRYSPVDLRNTAALFGRKQRRRPREQYTLVVELFFLDEEPLYSSSTQETPDHEFFSTHVESFSTKEEVIDWFLPKHRGFDMYEESQFWEEFLREAGIIEGDLETGRGLPDEMGGEASQHGFDHGHDGYPWPPESRTVRAEAKRGPVSSLDEVHERDIFRVVFLLDGEMRTDKFQAREVKYDEDGETVVECKDSKARLRAFDAEDCTEESGLGASLMFRPASTKGYMDSRDGHWRVWCPCWPVRMRNVRGWTDEQLGYDA